MAADDFETKIYGGGGEETLSLREAISLERKRLEIMEQNLDKAVEEKAWELYSKMGIVEATVSSIQQGKLKFQIAFPDCEVRGSLSTAMPTFIEPQMEGLKPRSWTEVIEKLQEIVIKESGGEITPSLAYHNFWVEKGATDPSCPRCGYIREWPRAPTGWGYHDDAGRWHPARASIPKFVSALCGLAFIIKPSIGGG